MQITPERAYDQHHKAVYSFAWRLTGREDVAEDITQECFLALLRAPERYDPDRGSIRVYLFSIARNLALKQYRDERWEQIDLEVAGTTFASLEFDLPRAVAAAVAALPRLQQEAIILFEYEGATLEEIAQIVAADVGTVKSRLHRARQSLRRALVAYRKVVNSHGTV